MKTCIGCVHAEWDRNVSGRLMPSGNGKCAYPYKVPTLPASMYWISRSEPLPYGGYINRRKELKVHCPYYLRDNK